MLRRFIAGFLLAAVPAGATQVDWNGLPFSTNLTSTGQPWDDSWVAELGSFAGSFTPASTNTATWAAAWRAASRSPYQSSTAYFGGSYSYDQNTAPFLTGAWAWLWLFNPKAPQGEWILLGNPAWTWPAGSSFDPATTTWASSNATESIVGELPGPGWALKCAAITNSPLPSLTFAGWKALYFSTAELADTAISGFAADPDGDGTSNFAEYGGGSLPRRANSFPPPAEVVFPVVNNQTYFGARLRINPRITGFRWAVNAATEPGFTQPLSVTVITDLPWEFSVRCSNPMNSGSSSAKGFIRFLFR